MLLCLRALHAPQEEGWICNSSICMTKRGLKPTGIAIFEAQGKGFASVGHYVQVRAISAPAWAAIGSVLTHDCVAHAV